jgi:hypothetical protein
MSTNKKEYLCQVTVIEARELSMEDPTETCDPFVKVTCGNLPSQATTCEEANTNPCWNQSFTFSNLNLTEYELETWELKIELYDYSAFTRNRLIGGYSIGLSTLHRNSNHEFYNIWLTLLHPDFGSEPRGYVQVNAFIVGPEDSPPAHALGEQVGYEEDESEDDAWMDDLLTPEQRKLKKLEAKKVVVVGAPKFARKSYQLSVNIYKAEGIPEEEFSVCNGFVSVRAMGLVDKTQTVEANSNPIWNSKISFPVFEPILNDKIVVRVWSKVFRGRDRLIATIPEVPSRRDPFNITTLLSRGGVMPCRWFSLYGHPESEKTLVSQLKNWTGLAKKSYVGNVYMGRVLISMTVAPNDDPETGVNRANPYREPPDKMFILRCTIYELKNARGCGDKVRIKISIGSFFQFSKTAAKKEGVDSQKKSYDYYVFGSAYSGEAIREIKEPFPVDPTQTPDVLVELYTDTFIDGEKRIGYIRRHIPDIIEDDKPKWIPFKSIETHSEVGEYSPGLLLIGFNYSLDGNISKIQRSRPRKVEMYFHACVYGGYDIAPSIAEEETETFFRIYVGDNVIEGKPAMGKYPRWVDFEIDNRKVCLHEDLGFENNLKFQLFQKTSYLKIKREIEIGSFTVPLITLEKKWSQPNFFHLVNPAEEGVSQGRILAEFYITKESFRDQKINPCRRDISKHICDVQLAIVGVRNLNPPYRHPKLRVEIPGYTMNDGESKPARIEIVPNDRKDELNPNFLQIVTFPNVELPVEPIYLPAVSVKLIDDFFFGNESFTFIPLISYAHWIREEAVKREAQELYNRNFTQKELVEQIPLASKQAIEIVKGDDYFTDYSDTSMLEEGDQDVTSTQKIINKKAENELMDIFEPKNSKLADKIQFDKRMSDQEYENELLETTRRELLSELETQEAAVKSYEKLKSANAPDEMLLKVRALKKKLGLLDEMPMTEAKFWKRDEDYEDDGAFNYNRPVLKDSSVEETLKLPYERYILFKKTKNSKILTTHRVGDPTGAIIKISVHLKIKKPAKGYEDYKEEEDPVAIPFNFFYDSFEGRPDLMEVFKKQVYNVRVYLLRALSISGVDNVPDLIAFAAGHDAVSSADTYPEIIIGNDKDIVGKYINEEMSPETNTLNPNFFRYYNMNASFPTDWRLLINIWDKGSWKSNLVGSTYIDIEDRYFGDENITERLMIQRLKKLCDTKIEGEEDPVIREKFSNLKKRVKKRQGYLASNRKPVPVEYRSLSNPKKKTVQGNLELWVELYEMNESKLIPVTKIAKPQPEKYQMRIVIWRCEAIPKGEHEAIDILYQLQFDPQGWIEEALTKQTDTHFGSEDGHAIHNWRILYDFELPCPFARLNIAAYKFNTFGSDELLAENVIDMSKYFRTLLKEGKVTLEEQWVDLHIPNQSHKPAGKVLISLYMLTKAEADNRPVGEGRDEPNRDPMLETPEEGRGIGDFLKGTAFDVSKWSLFNFGLIKKLLAVGSVLAVMFVLFVYPGVAVK